MRRTSQLFEVERIATRVLIERRGPLVGTLLPQHRGGLLARQRVQLDASETAIAKRSVENAAQSRRTWGGASTEGEQHGRRRWPMQEAAHEVDRRRVSPVEVIEDEHHRLGRREPFEQLAHRTIGSVTLGLWRDATAASGCRYRGEHLGELASNVVFETA